MIDKEFRECSENIIHNDIKTNKNGKLKSRKMIIDTFKDELNYVKNEDIKEFAILVLRSAPTYFFTAASSSSGKYHPDYENCKGGLILHTRSVTYLLNNMLSLEMYAEKFSEREIDLIIVSAILHDIKKHGNNNRCAFTQFEHPRIAQEFIKSFKGNGLIPDKEIDYIGDCVCSHMGQWNTRGKKSSIPPLEKPQSLQQQLLHLADFLATKPELDLQKYLFKDGKDPNKYLPKDEVKKQKMVKDDGTLCFGKYKSKTINEIFEEDPEYLNWLYTTNSNMKKTGSNPFLTDDVLEKIKTILFDVA